MGMYKKDDFSHEAMRSAGIEQDKKSGEFCLKIWFGTESMSNATAKANKVMRVLPEGLKTFPGVSSKKRASK